MARDVVKTLLIEDDSDIEQYFSALLKTAPCYDFDLSYAKSFETVRTALAEPDTKKPELIILDLTFHGGVSGLPLVKEVRAMCPEALIVVYTGTDDDATEVAALKLGVQDYIVKASLTAAQTLERVRMAVTRYRAFMETHVLRKLIDKGEKIIKACEASANLPPYKVAQE